MQGRGNPVHICMQTQQQIYCFTIQLLQLVPQDSGLVVYSRLHLCNSNTTYIMHSYQRTTIGNILFATTTFIINIAFMHSCRKTNSSQNTCMLQSQLAVYSFQSPQLASTLEQKVCDRLTLCNTHINWYYYCLDNQQATIQLSAIFLQQFNTVFCRSKFQIQHKT